MARRAWHGGAWRGVRGVRGVRGAWRGVRGMVARGVGRGGAPMATKSSLTFVAVFALVSMKKMPLSFEYVSASCKRSVSGSA